jgi:hypothetical protein
MCLNETYSKLSIVEMLSDAHSIENSLHNDMLYHHCF